MESVRFGLIGLGNIGSHHIANFKGLQNGTLAAICDVDPARRDKFASQYNVPAFDDPGKMMDSGKVDAVIVAVPHYDHARLSLAAFQRGLHVLCEKPVCVSVNEARKLNDEYTKKYSNLKFSLMFNLRTVNLYSQMRGLITSGELGEISRVTWVVTDWFRTWHYFASGGWRATWAGEGGGILINQCPHNLDLMQWITGLMPSRITAVAAIAKSHPIEVEDEVSAILEYPNGAIGHFITTTGEAPGSNRFEIAGDRGKIVSEGGTLNFYRTRESVKQVLQTSKSGFAKPETWEINIPLKKAAEGHIAITQNFTNAILKNEALISPGIEGVRSLEIGNAMLMAGVTRKPVDLPMDGEAYDRFLKDMEKQYGGKKASAAAKGATEGLAGSFGT